MSTIDGTEIDAVTIDGQEVQEITMDGNVVWKAEQLVDDYSVGSLDDRYWANDPGQAEWPYPTGDTYGFGSGYHGFLHQDNSPNHFVSLAPDNPNHSSSTQGGGTVEGEYFGPGDIVEVYWRWQTEEQIRFIFNASQYSSAGCLRLRITPESGGYWRLETISSGGSWSYYGGTSGGAPEDFVSLTEGEAYRTVIDMSNWPTVDCHLYNSSGTHRSTIGNSESNPDWSDRGFGFWGNDIQQTEWGPIRHIDADEI